MSNNDLRCSECGGQHHPACCPKEIHAQEQRIASSRSISKPKEKVEIPANGTTWEYGQVIKDKPKEDWLVELLIEKHAFCCECLDGVSTVEVAQAIREGYLKRLPEEKQVRYENSCKQMRKDGKIKETSLSIFYDKEERGFNEALKLSKQAIQP